jgi:hypothetical protein
MGGGGSFNIGLVFVGLQRPAILPLVLALLNVCFFVLFQLF